jgi:hypothetical protein
MMRLSKTIKIMLLLVIFLGLSYSFASADDPMPQTPCWFYGTVKNQGENVVLDTLVQAIMDGVVVDETLSTEYELDSVYVLEIPGDSSMEGKTIRFLVDGQPALQTALWQSGEQTELNLVVGWMIFAPIILH